MRRGLGIAIASTIALAVTACGSSGKSSSGGGGAQRLGREDPVGERDE